MPNWCTNDICITGKDMKKYREFCEKSLKDNIADTKYEGTDFGAGWLGNLLLSAGEDYEKVKQFHMVNARGNYEITDATNDQLSISAESAWGPCYDVFRYVAEKMGFDVDVDYYAEEPGCGVYVASDRSMTDDGDYYIDGYFDGEGADYLLPLFSDNPFWKKDILIEEIQKALQTEETDIDKLIDMVLEVVDKVNEISDTDSYISINEIEFEN